MMYDRCQLFMLSPVKITRQRPRYLYLDLRT